MASFMKEVKDLVGSTTTTAKVVLNGVNMLVSATTSTIVDTVEELGISSNNLMRLSSNYTTELKLESDYSLAKTKLVIEAKTEALTAVIADKAVKAKLIEAEKASIINSIFEDYDLQAAS